MLTAHLNKKLSELILQGEKFAIAYSGGGDSTALVHALKDHPQADYIYIVDHDLREGSAIEAAAAQTFAKECGYKAKLLKWRHNSPSTALQERARCARYGLMGDQCRQDGIKYLLTAHSEDDQAETLLMRYERKTDWRGAAGMAEISYGPVWPELAMVSILRPLLEVSRSALRDYNRAHDIDWAEDPSNQNMEFARIRARDHLKSRMSLKTDLLETAREMRSYLKIEKQYLREQFAQIAHIDENGIINLRQRPEVELMFQCLRAASGQGKMIDRAKIKNLLFKMNSPEFVSATLGGALIARHKSNFIICRDPVAAKGRQDGHHHRSKDAPDPLYLTSRPVPQIWDGRFIMTGPQQDSGVGSVFSNHKHLSRENQQKLKSTPAPARPTLPVLIESNKVLAIGHEPSTQHHLQCIVKMRLEAALGGRVS